MKIVDLSVFRKEELTIKSLTGEEYVIPGNIPTQLFITLYDYFDRIQDTKKKEANSKKEFTETMQLLKEIALEIIKLDKSKEVSLQTIDDQFNDINVLEMLLSAVMQHINEVTADPNSHSLPSA